MPGTIPPTREEFADYWKDYDTVSWRQFAPYVVYLGGLALYAWVVPRIAGEFWLASILGAAAYLILLPYFWIKRVHTRDAQFIRCPQCGDWFGWDSSGTCHGPNPRFKTVIQTGKCGKCGRQILAEP
jgi:hypothetical protein